MLRIVLLSLVAVAAAQQATFDNYKVFRVLPESRSQLEVLQQLEDDTNEFSFWSGPSYVNRSVDVMVSPSKIPQFYELMDQIGTPYEPFVNNVQELIDAERIAPRAPNFDFKNYHTLEQIYAYLDDLQKSHPGKVQVVVGGKTYEGRQIKGVKVSFKSGNPGIFIEGGIHAREWISPATVLYILDRLLNSNDREVRQLAERHDWYIFPVFNPDGYVYTHTTNRMWRKTRTRYTALCHGADPNRNWDYKWMNGGASNNPCSETYGGSAAFSDVETKTMSQYIQSISNKFYAYISFHSYSQLLMFPYGHTTAHLENYDELKAIGVKTINALAKKYGTKYSTGNVAETIYVATGSTVDWVKGALHKPIAYTYELRDSGKHGFILPANQIIPTGEETLDSLVALFKEAKARGHP